MVFITEYFVCVCVIECLYFQKFLLNSECYMLHDIARLLGKGGI